MLRMPQVDLRVVGEFGLNNCLCCYPPASKASREEANLTERKNPHTPLYGVKECF